MNHTDRDRSYDFTHRMLRYRVTHHADPTHVSQEFDMANVAWTKAARQYFV
jgi:hypothetical protein